MVHNSKLSRRDARTFIRHMAALANRTRLDCYLMLLEKHEEGMFATDIARRLKVSKHSMSTHFNILRDAGLVRGERDGRTVTYRANAQALAQALLTVLTVAGKASA